MIASLHHNYLLLIGVTAAVPGFGLGGPSGFPVLPGGHFTVVLYELLEEAPLVLEILEETAAMFIVPFCS